MISDPILQWAFTAAFAATALRSLFDLLVVRHGAVNAIGHGLALLMSVDMAFMSWPAWKLIPVWLELTLFSFGIVWFGAVAWLRFTRPRSQHRGGHHSAWHQLAHAVMMIAMTWMVYAMAFGMGAGDEALSGAHDHHALPLWLVLSGLLCTVALIGAGAIQAAQIASPVRADNTSSSRFSAIADVVMHLAMAAMCWTML